MHPELSQLRREWNGLVERGIRLGQLPLEPLCDLYGALLAAQPDGADAPRIVDLRPLEWAWQAVPASLWDASSLQLLEQLPRTEAPPSPSPGLACVSSPDGRLLGEVGAGSESVARWALLWCRAAWQMRKAHALLQAAQGALPKGGEAAPTQLELAELGFVLGHEVGALERLDPALLARLQRPATPLTLSLPAHLAPAAQHHLGVALGRTLVAALAEQGLAQRPLHLVLGDACVIDCLSPFFRDLAPELCAWAQRPMAAVDGGELMAIGRRFLASDRRLAAERAAADRSVGICACPLQATDAPLRDGPVAHLVDLQRLDPGACDVELEDWQRPSEAAVLVHLPCLPTGQLTALLETFFAALHAQLRSVALLAPGAPLPGDVAAGAAAAAWPGALVTDEGHLLPLPPCPDWIAEAARLMPQAPRHGVGWCCSSAPLAAHGGSPSADDLPVVCVDAHSAAVLAACSRAELRHGAAWGANLSVAVVPQGAPLQLWRAVALGRLRLLGGPPAAPPAAPSGGRRTARRAAAEAASPDQLARRSIFWALRLKA